MDMNCGIETNVYMYFQLEVGQQWGAEAALLPPEVGLRLQQRHRLVELEVGRRLQSLLVHQQEQHLEEEVLQLPVEHQVLTCYIFENFCPPLDKSEWKKEHLLMLVLPAHDGHPDLRRHCEQLQYSHGALLKERKSLAPVLSNVPFVQCRLNVFEKWTQTTGLKLKQIVRVTWVTTLLLSYFAITLLPINNIDSSCFSCILCEFVPQSLAELFIFPLKYTCVALLLQRHRQSHQHQHLQLTNHGLVLLQSSQQQLNHRHKLKLR